MEVWLPVERRRRGGDVHIWKGDAAHLEPGTQAQVGHRCSAWGEKGIRGRKWRITEESGTGAGARKGGQWLSGSSYL